MTQVISPSDVERFIDLTRWVYLWRLRSNELYESAAVVWNGKVDRVPLPNGGATEIHLLYRPAQLLMGLCLESLLKGLIVARRPEIVSNARLPDELRTHSLEKLFQECDILLKESEDELNLIRKLSEAVEWVSKYPAPSQAAHLVQPKHNGERPMIRHEQDFERFALIRERVLAAYPASDA